MHLDLPDVLQRTKGYLETLQTIEDGDSIGVDSTTIRYIKHMAGKAGQELHGMVHLFVPTPTSFEQRIDDLL